MPVYPLDEEQAAILITKVATKSIDKNTFKNRFIIFLLFIVIKINRNRIYIRLLEGENRFVEFLSKNDFSTVRRSRIRNNYIRDFP